MLADGGKITKTQSAIVLEKLIGQFLFDKAAPEAANEVTRGQAVPGAWCCMRARCAGDARRLRDDDGPRRAADPFEPMNRTMYQVHEPIDAAVIRPVAQAYIDIRAARRSREVSTNFFSNIDDLFSAVNGAPAGQAGQSAGHDLGRVVLNTLVRPRRTVRSRVEGRHPERGNEDFGQTFGAWGIPQGPYLFIPLFGPDDGARRNRRRSSARSPVPSATFPTSRCGTVLYGVGYRRCCARSAGDQHA